mgnify:CR=1 FL=1
MTARPIAFEPAARRALKMGDSRCAVCYLKRALEFMSTGAYVYTDENAANIALLVRICAVLLLVLSIGISGLIIVALLGFHQEAELKKKGWYADAGMFISKK